MKKTSFTVKMILKKEKIKADGTAPIYVRVRLNSEKMELSTNKSIVPLAWDSKHARVTKHPLAKDINSYLDAFKGKLTEAYSQLFIAQQDITLDAIRTIVLGKPSGAKHTIIQVAEEHNQHFQSLVGVKYSGGSYKNYKTTLKYLQEFVPRHSRKRDIPLENVDYSFCQAFYVYLTTEKTCRTNGANKQIQRLKKIMNYAIRHGYIKTNPLATYTLEFERVHKEALTLQEINKLMNLQLHRPVLQQVRDVFLLQCFTGLSYGDVRNLKMEHISKGDNGGWWIRMKRQKTNVSFSIPLLEPALVLLNSYIPPTDPINPIMPVLSNQKMNDNLKVLQELAGIQKTLTTHLARHSFATIALNNDVPLVSVSSMLGHTKLATTQIYAKVLEGKIENDMKLLGERLKKNAE